jgi:YaiO family outer membrane protein
MISRSDNRRVRLRRSGLLLGLIFSWCCTAPIALAQTWADAIAAGDYALALRELDTALHADPSNTTLRYQHARVAGLSGATETALAEFDALLASYPDDADYLLGRAQMLARLGRVPAAVATTERGLTVAPGYEDLWRLRLQLAEREGDAAEVASLREEGSARFPASSWWQAPPTRVEYRRSVTTGFGGDRLSNGAPDWSREFARLDWRVADAAVVYGELAREERFEETDSSLNVGGSWRILPAWRQTAAFAVTDDPRFLPSREWSFDSLRQWADGWGSAFGFRRREYPTAAVSSVSFSGEKYVSDFRVAYRLDYSKQSGADAAISHALTFAWYPSERRNLAATLGTGEEIEIIGLDQLLRTPVENVTLSGAESLSTRITLNWYVGTHEQGDFYRRDYAGLAVRVGF